MLGLDVAHEWRHPFSDGQPGNLIDFGAARFKLGQAIVLARLDDAFAHVLSAAPNDPTAPLRSPRGRVGRSLVGSTGNQIGFGGNIVARARPKYEGFAAVSSPTVRTAREVLRCDQQRDRPRASGPSARLGRQTQSPLARCSWRTPTWRHAIQPHRVDDALLGPPRHDRVGWLRLGNTAARRRRRSIRVAVHPSGSLVIIGRYSGASASADGPPWQGPLPGGAGTRGSWLGSRRSGHPGRGTHAILRVCSACEHEIPSLGNVVAPKAGRRISAFAGLPSSTARGPPAVAAYRVESFSELHAVLRVGRREDWRLPKAWLFLPKDGSSRRGARCAAAGNDSVPSRYAAMAVSFPRIARMSSRPALLARDETSFQSR